MTTHEVVWVFCGPPYPTGFPANPTAVFSTRAKAEEWIQRYGVSGLLTAYPVDESAYDWVQSHGRWKPTEERHTQPEFIARFEMGYTPHFHYDDGVCRNPGARDEL